MVSAIAAPIQAQYVTLQLISDHEQIAPGDAFTIALQVNLEPHWHLYWTNPGASGFPLDLVWKLPPGLTAGEIQWPTPSRLPISGLMNYGYENQVTYLIPFQASASLPVGQTLQISAEASWLICKESCLPGDALLQLKLPVAARSQASSEAELIHAARELLPQSVLAFPVSAEFNAAAGRLQLKLQAAAGLLAEDLYFYASSAEVIDPNAEQVRSDTSHPNLSCLTLPATTNFLAEPVERLIGVLQSGEQSWQLDLPIFEVNSLADTTVDEAIASAPHRLVSGNAGFEQRLLDLGLPGFLVLAFLGGLILNVMPCVLPVLSLKVFSLLKHSGQSKRHALAHGLAYTGGVVASFLVLAAALYALRALGERVGWGFQLQNPSFVVVLAVVFW